MRALPLGHRPVIHVAIPPSQFPERIRADLIDSLRRREIRHKFHYDSYKQAQKWLAVHEAHSPARTDSDTQQIYGEAFRHVASGLGGASVQVIGLGLWRGQRMSHLLQELSAQVAKRFYTAVDVSLPLVITASRNAPAGAYTGRTTGPRLWDLEIGTISWTNSASAASRRGSSHSSG
jgi:hypothetical protein